LIVRYATSEDGKLEKKAELYTAAEHGIRPQDIDADARLVVDRLQAAGFEAFIVGGAVRDLLAGRKPKDFDIATSAYPKQIHRVFPRSRIIGRRFKLVHVPFTRNRKQKIIEVSTFRADGGGRGNNTYGSLEEDVRRRDFTINALFYNPHKQLVIDYVGGFKDIKAKRLRTLRPVEESFSEDPVRMIRGVKYAALLGIPLPFGVTGAIKKYRRELLRCSKERVTEEVFKILTSGCAQAFFSTAYRIRLLEVILPSLDGFLRRQSQDQEEAELFRRLSRLDELMRSEAPAASGTPLEVPERGEMLALLFQDLLAERPLEAQEGDPLFHLQAYLRTLSLPLLPSKADLLAASTALLKILASAACPAGAGRKARRAI